MFVEVLTTLAKLIKIKSTSLVGVQPTVLFWCATYTSGVPLIVWAPLTLTKVGFTVLCLVLKDFP